MSAAVKAALTLERYGESLLLLVKPDSELLMSKYWIVVMLFTSEVPSVTILSADWEPAGESNHIRMSRGAKILHVLSWMGAMRAEAKDRLSIKYSKKPTVVPCSSRQAAIAFKVLATTSAKMTGKIVGPCQSSEM